MAGFGECYPPAQLSDDVGTCCDSVGGDVHRGQVLHVRMDQGSDCPSMSRGDVD